MSKRRNKSNRPNVPQSTLDRAREQARADSAQPVDVEEADEPLEAASQPAPAPVKAESAPAAAPKPKSGNGDSSNPYVTVPARERRARTGIRADEGGTVRRVRRDRKVSEGLQKDETLDAETIAYLLHHPTKTVSEDELRRDYSYVLADLRSMGILAVGLVATLVVLAFVFVR